MSLADRICGDTLYGSNGVVVGCNGGVVICGRCVMGVCGDLW